MPNLNNCSKQMAMTLGKYDWNFFSRQKYFDKFTPILYIQISEKVFISTSVCIHLGSVIYQVQRQLSGCPSVYSPFPRMWRSYRLGNGARKKWRNSSKMKRRFNRCFNRIELWRLYLRGLMLNDVFVGINEIIPSDLFF